MTLEALFAGRPIDIPAVLRHLEQTARGLGLPFGARRLSFNSRRAQEAAKWAEAAGKGDAFRHAVFRAAFAEGKNIYALATLAAAAASAGLDGAELAAALDRPEYQEAVDADWRRSRELGVTAVPTFRRGGFHLVGAQPYERLAAFLQDPRRAGAFVVQRGSARPRGSG
jgi:predicted DsbA family dithiol-disulfide isomerase